MATVKYLSGGEPPTAELMNDLFVALDGKLAQMLGGRSFFLAQDWAVPQRLCGKAFFFTAGKAVYAARVPGYIDNGGGVARPYNHQQFLTAQAAINLSQVTYDEANRIATIPRVASGNYLGLPQNNVVGFFEWSLQTHFLMHQGSNDKAPVPYYLREAVFVNVQPPPEKHFTYALAEIIIEGVSAVTIESQWDKYQCFRIHNFNPNPVTINFPGYSLTLQRFQCATVRRDLGNANYRTGNYFFGFSEGDYRFYWFMPTQGGGIPAIGDDGRASNTMQANNLSNPAILFDWIQFFQRTGPFGSANNISIINPFSGLLNGGGGTSYANFIEDFSEQCDVYPFYKNFYGDPSNPNTLLGDLLHHKGEITIIRASRAKKDPITNYPLLTFDKVTFNGYGTIVQDFAAKKITVAENSSGNLVITSADTENDVWLISSGTNLFKTGDLNPNSIFKLGSITIESAIFEDQTGKEATSGPWSGSLTMNSAAPQYIFQPLVNVQKNYRTYYDSYTFTQTTLNLGAIPPWDGGKSYNPGEVVTFPNINPAIAIQPSQGMPPSGDPNSDANWNIGTMSSGFFGYWKKSVIYGDDIQTLTWPNNSRGLLSTPTVLDGGSGYGFGDVFYLHGGAGDRAILQILDAPGGEVAPDGIGVIYPGNYTGAPPNPNEIGAGDYIFPDQTQRGARHGVGLRLSINIPIKTLNGIHKLTVADILKMDWWGDPRQGDQNSAYVNISNRRLMFTPQGLVLTYTEQDSSLQANDPSTPNGFPKWKNGNRGIPRNLVLKFRGHGFGYISEGYNGVMSGYQTSGYLSCREPRFFVSHDYQHEVFGKDGVDFSVPPLGTSASQIQVQGRIKTTDLQVIKVGISFALNARFWKTSNPGNDNLGNFFMAKKVFNDREFAVAWQLNAWQEVIAPTVAMALLPEMYNALARAVNAVKTAVPLSWQCLRFNVGGNIITLDPTLAINSLKTGQSPSGGTGWISPPGGGGGFYTGPRPKNQFCSFMVNSLFEQLCKQLNIPVSSSLDFPGGDDGLSNNLNFSDFQNKFSAAAVSYDKIAGTVTGGGVTLGQPSSFDVPVNIKGTFNLDLSSGLLSTKAIQDGRPPGAGCVGTFDPYGPAPNLSSLKAGEYLISNDGRGFVLCNSNSTLANGSQQSVAFNIIPINVSIIDGGRNYKAGDQLAWNPDGILRLQIASVDAGGKMLSVFITSQIASVALPLPGPSGVAVIGGSGSGGIVKLDFSQFRGTDAGSGVCPTVQPLSHLALYGGSDNSNYNWTDLNGFGDYRWVTIESVKNFIEGYGFIFTYTEAVEPLALRYFEDFLSQNNIGGNSHQEINFNFNLIVESTWGASRDLVLQNCDGSEYFRGRDQTQLNAAFVNSQKLAFAQFNAIGSTPFGTLIKFCRTSDSKKALWKINCQAAKQIANVTARKKASPLTRWFGYGGGSIAAVSFSGSGPPRIDPNETGFVVFSMGLSFGNRGTLQPGQTPDQCAQPQESFEYGGVERDLISVRYADGYGVPEIIQDQFETMGILRQSGGTAPMNVLGVGVGTWGKVLDSWDSLNGIFELTGSSFTSGKDPLPWVYYPAPQDIVMPAGDGLTVMSCPQGQQRYLCCFDLATAAISLT